jgi:hypothetical protein
VTYIYLVTYICPTKFSSVGFCPTKFKLCPTKIKSDRTNVLSSQIFICSHALTVLMLLILPRLFIFTTIEITFLTVFILTHPVNFYCGRKPECLEKPTTFGRALTDSFHMSPWQESNPKPPHICYQGV